MIITRPVEVNIEVDVEIFPEDISEYIETEANRRELLTFKEEINEKLGIEDLVEVLNPTLHQEKYREIFIEFENKIDPWELETLLEEFIKKKA